MDNKQKALVGAESDSALDRAEEAQLSGQSGDQDEGMEVNQERNGENETNPFYKLIASFEGKRRGPWSEIEEAYASKLIHYFNRGLLTCDPDMKLRSLLTTKLFWYSYFISSYVHDVY
jgi:hypothetical protein